VRLPAIALYVCDRSERATRDDWMGSSCREDRGNCELFFLAREQLDSATRKLSAVDIPDRRSKCPQELPSTADKANFGRKLIKDNRFHH
jgi:hypothetical protein